MKKILLFGLVGLVFAGPTIFQEIKVGNTKYFIQKNVSDETLKLVPLNKFIVETKGLVKILNIYLTHQKIFNSAEDTTAPVMSSLVYAIRQIVETNDYLWKKPVKYEGKEYEKIYNLFNAILNDRLILLSNEDKTFLKILSQEDIINRLISLENRIIKFKNSKLNKTEILKIREFYLLLGDLLKNYKSNLLALKKIKHDKSLNNAIDEVVKKLDLVLKNIYINVKNLNKWDSIKIFSF